MICRSCFLITRGEALAQMELHTAHKETIKKKTGDEIDQIKAA